MLNSSPTPLIVEDSLNLARDLATLQGSFDQAVKSANEIAHSVDVVIDAFTNLGDLGLGGIAELILTKKLARVEDVGELLQITKKLPSLFKDMQSVIPTLQRTARDLQDRAPQLGSILDSSWQSESTPVKNAITAIQTSVRNNLLEKVNGITSKVGQMQDILNGLVGRGLFPTLDVKVASYRRWSHVSLDLPCSKTSRKTFSLAGFKTTFDYPEFYSCPYAEEVSFPNHHIPYIRLQLGNNKRSLMEPYHLDNSSSSLILDASTMVPVTLSPDDSTGRKFFTSTYILGGAAIAVLIYAMFKIARRIPNDNRNVKLQREEMSW